MIFVTTNLSESVNLLYKHREKMVKKNKRPNFYLITVVLVLIICISCYMLLYIEVDIPTYVRYVANLSTRKFNETLGDLKNANVMQNISYVNLSASNPELMHLLSCDVQPKFLGPVVKDPSVYLKTCFRDCGGNSEVVQIEHENEEWIYGSTKLGIGAWCVVHPPDCNLKTSYVVRTVNAVKCQSKFPHLFGGVTGDLIVACNDYERQSANSQLWDMAENVQITGANVRNLSIRSEDELLPDGSRRFVCKFGEGPNGNKFTHLPNLPYHPIEDRCIEDVPFASLDAHVNWTKNSFTCECGDFNKTRIKNKDPNDKQSKCTSCISSYDESKKLFTLARECWTVNFPMQRLMMNPYLLPCPGDKFNSAGNFCVKEEFHHVFPAYDEDHAYGLPFVVSNTFVNHDYGHS